MGKKQQGVNVGRRDFIKKGAAIGVGATALAGLGTQDADAQAPARWDLEADVRRDWVRGHGDAAAIRARDQGASVIVVETNYEWWTTPF